MATFKHRHNQSATKEEQIPRADPTERLRKLEESEARIRAEIQRVRGRAAQEARKRDTHRKILVGAMVLDQVQRGEWQEKRLKEAMDRFLEKDRDRAVFELPPRLPVQQPTPNPTAQQRPTEQKPAR